MSEKKEKYTVVVLAAGKGTRMGGSVAKQFSGNRRKTSRGLRAGGF